MTNNTNKPAPKTPVFRKQLPGGISTAVFENTRDGRTYRSINLQRSYRKDGKWQRMSMYLDHEHIPFFIEVLQGTWDFLNTYPVGTTLPNDGSDSSEVIEVATDVEILDAA